MLAMSFDLDRVRQELAASGTLRVGLNLSNFLLINPGTGDKVPEGIVPDLARALASELGVAIEFVPYPSPGPLGDAVEKNAWDVAFLANEPARAQTIAFSPAYLEIQASYLVPAGSPLKRVEDVDRPGVRIATMRGGAYALYLERSLKHAELVLTRSIDESFEVFVAQGLQALSGLRPRLLSDQARLAGSVVLPGHFTAVQQAIGTSQRHSVAASFLADFAQRARDGGRVQQAIDRHRVPGVNVAQGLAG
jgi:polar amino acid transport system substrate-binding protein